MAATKKSKFPGAPTFVISGLDETFSDKELIYIKDLDAGASETATKLQAIAESGVTINQLHSNETLGALGVRATDISVQLLQDQQALVIVSWGVGNEPLLDGAWIYETMNVSRTVTRGIDFDNEQLKIKYFPLGITDAEAAWLAKNKREYDRGTTVPAREDLIQVVGRRQISSEQAALMDPHPKEWVRKFGTTVNEEEDVGAGLVKGTWLQNNMRIYSRNRERSFIVEASFLYDRRGHESFVIFQDRFGLIPKDVTIPDGMKTPWPTVREATVRPYGVIRPQTLKGTVDFSAAPLSFDLLQFSNSDD